MVCTCSLYYTFLEFRDTWGAFAARRATPIAISSETGKLQIVVVFHDNDDDNIGARRAWFSNTQRWSLSLRDFAYILLDRSMVIVRTEEKRKRVSPNGQTSEPDATARRDFTAARSSRQRLLISICGREIRKNRKIGVHMMRILWKREHVFPLVIAITGSAFCARIVFCLRAAHANASYI